MLQMAFKECERYEIVQIFLQFASQFFVAETDVKKNFTHDVSSATCFALELHCKKLKHLPSVARS